MRKRVASPFSLSFLDIMFCGFGAVVLLVMLLNREVLVRREDVHEDLGDELARASALLAHASAHVDELEREVQAAALEEGDLRSSLDRLDDAVDSERRSAERLARESRDRAARIEAMEHTRAVLEKTASAIEREAVAAPARGRARVGFSGDGRRQYLTGLKLGGERTVVLVDASASMLAETVVNAVRRKLMSEAVRRDAPKWQRAVRAAHWLVSNLQPGRQFQVYAFNTEAWAVIDGTGERWLGTDDAPRLGEAVAALRAIAPEKGTSLHNAFAAIGRLSPRPDSVVLLTDGLPTQGAQPSGANSISADERLALFRGAVDRLPKGIAINTLLYPMEGDPAAAAAFWELAIRTDGSFITPSRDWP